MVSNSERRFIRINFISIIATLVVILAGGVVRSTGSGMGCPDWPKCFDQYIPPTNASQLRADYETKYLAGRQQKNEKFASLLERIGKKTLADSIRNDQSILVHEDFNAAKTWTEYVNRLTGAVLGLFLLLTAFFSFAYKKKAKRIVVLSVANIFVVAFQGWLGSIVVSTNLTQWILTVHMLLALVLLAILIYTYHYAKQLYKEPTVIIYRIMWLRIVLLFSIVVTVLQIVLGTEVREAIDVIAKSLQFNDRHMWISKIGDVFNYHRDLAILVIIINIVVYKMVVDRFSGKALPLITTNYLIFVLIVQVVSGLLLSYLALPGYAQVIHLLFSMVMFTLQFYLYLQVYRTETYQTT